MISSDNPNGGHEPPEAIAFAKLVVGASHDDSIEELRNLLCLRLRDEIKANAESHAQHLSLFRRTQLCKEVMPAFVGALLVAIAVLPVVHISQQGTLALIVLAGLTIARSPAEFIWGVDRPSRARRY